MGSLSVDTSFVTRGKALVDQALKQPHTPTTSKERAESALAEQGEPTLSDKLAEASRAANITAEGGG